MEKVKLVQVTPDAEQTMAYIARVSNPKNQENPSFEGLLKYCIKHGHWSVFEQAYMTLEIETSRAIAAQILRHRSSHIKSFPSGMLIPVCLLMKFLCQNFGVKIPRIVRILLTILMISKNNALKLQ